MQKNDKQYAIDLGERISEVANLCGGVKSLAAKTGITDVQLYRYIKGQNLPNALAISKLADFANVQMEWLVTGKGDMFSTVPTEDVEKVRDPSEGEYVYVPLFDQSVSAGHGAAAIDRPQREKLAFLKEWIKSRGLSTKDLFLLPVSGESMEPTLSQGDVVLVDKSVDHVCGDGLYVLRLDHHLYIKRLQRLPGGEIAVISDNPAYEKFSIGPGTNDDVAIIGRVVWVGKEV